MKRENGYYHVRIHNYWEIAKWDSKLKVWTYKGIPWVDRDFDEIDERRIVREEVITKNENP